MSRRVSNVVKSTPRYNLSARLRQTFLASGPVLISVCFGIVEGYSAILLPQLEKEKLFDIDLQTSSWIASIAALPMPIGSVLGGWLMEVIGRRGINMVCCFPALLGWLLIYFAQSLPVLLVGRFVGGLCAGLAGPSDAVYFAETTDPDFRGFLLGTLATAFTTGILFAHVLGAYLHWRTVALVSCIIPILSFVLMCFVAESPTYYAKKNRFEDAKKAWYWCRGHSEKSQLELDELIKRQMLAQQQPKETLKTYLTQLQLPEFYKPLVIILIFFTYMQWSGNNGIAFYNVTIAKEVTGGAFDEYLATILLDIVRLFTSIAGCILLNYMTRRSNLLLSAVGSIICFFVLGSFLFVAKTHPNIHQDYGAIPLTAFIGVMGFMAIGIIPLPWAMSGEVFPLATRGLASGIVTTYNYALIFFVVKATPEIFSGFGTDGAFFLFGGVALLGTIIMFFILPETKGIPLYEIEDGFKKVINNETHQNL